MQSAPEQAAPEVGGPIEDLYAVVPAGGAGTRLWPLSRRAHPKFLLDLTGSGRTLLQGTWDRLQPLTGPDRVVVVTGRAHAGAVAEQLPDLPADALLAEPSPRDSMAAIGLAAAVLAHRHGDVVLASFAADHVIHGEAAFAQAVGAAVAAARDGAVATIGIAATTPSTAFGYIEVGEPLPGAAGERGARGVVAFREKPDAATAAEYVADGRHRWNAGMFVVRARVLLDHLAQQRPELAAGLTEIAAAWDTPAEPDTLARVWPTLEKIAIDYAIAEPVAAAGGVAVAPGDFAWDDVGDWDSLGALLAPDAGGVHVLGDADATLVRDSAGAVVVAAGARTVTVLGVPDAVVVDTPDALLVTTRDQAQGVKRAVDALAERGADRLL
ncbi:Mannose-1-phosphate guanylyltransferase (GDP) [Beutenbergia cavernae DSM 12333]|uniref:Mannose-1-phosphate guanylyltransferase (GDP) n=1 Tax=Beutenbergia cavernae (strain ATCC BAA-8 / DSM 12333 / CCUG 43141 / JCM 11478 / NBRC 16432 / NCIMB 13614 / HKI 0122) TaxID=471853 RepID=C5BZ79_BEUC1|nr:mannose-1-phosphate guanylyltransferase [Beutenbergia cavernae]ACQ81194.1 Mannose-1-phosphate guanylyltransferase (GDP) [Beutenbergia cavernae DSM 12333]